MHFIIFGNVPLSSWVLDTLLKRPSANVIGAVATIKKVDFTSHCLDYPSLAEFAVQNKIALLNEDEAIKYASTDKKVLGLTVRYPNILRKDYILSFNQGILNFHGGLLPGYRGMDIATHVIINNEDKSGATIHYLDEGVDTGDIVSRGIFPLQGNETAHDIFLKTQAQLQEEFLKLLPKIIKNEIPRISQQKFIVEGEPVGVYRRKDTNRLREVKPPFDENKIDRFARAFSFPGHEPAYISVNAGRIELIKKSNTNSQR
ncbi:MAG: formyltransferase family protein [Desulfovermiculus sp.]